MSGSTNAFDRDEKPGLLVAGLRKFSSLNIAICRWLDRLGLENLQAVGPILEFENLMRERMDSGKLRRILELGTGDRPMLDRANLEVYDGLDIQSPSQDKTGFHHFFVQSIEAPIIADYGYDLIFSKFLLEHVSDNRKSLAAIGDALEPDGIMIHLLPLKNHPYSWLTRICSHRLQNALIRVFRPQLSTETGYPVYFQLCSARALRMTLKELGFELERIKFYWWAEDYFESFFPAYVAIVLFNWINRKLGIESLASNVIFIAQRRRPTS